MNGINDDTFSPSELIYLYLDGEANAAQHAGLFAALAHDPELQTEFQDALQMRLSLATEVRQTLPPPSLKEVLLQKATIVSQGAAQAGVGTTIAPVASGTVSSMFAAVQSVLLPLLSAVAGTLIVATSVFPPTHSPVEPTGTIATAVQQAPPVVHNLVPDSSAPVEQSGVVEKGTARLLRTPVPASVQYTMHTERVISRDGITEQSTLAANVPPDGDSDMREESPSVLSVAPLAARYRITTEADHQVPPISSVQEPLLFAEADDTYRWTVYSRGIVGVQLFPWRSLESTGDFASNLAVGVLYHLNPELAAGIEVGRETLPLYAVGDGNILEQRSTIQWAGISGRYVPEYLILPGNIQPFATGVLGATGFGPLVKSVLGVRWQPDAHIGLSLGVEGTTLFYRYRQQWYNTQKIGASYGVEVRF